MVIPYSYCSLFTVKIFCCFTSLPSFPRKLSQLPAFTSFHNIHVHTFTKKFYSCEVANAQKRAIFTVNNKQ